MQDDLRFNRDGYNRYMGYNVTTHRKFGTICGLLARLFEFTVQELILHWRGNVKARERI